MSRMVDMLWELKEEILELDGDDVSMELRVEDGRGV